MAELVYERGELIKLHGFAGPILFGLLTAGLAIGAAITFSAASLFFIFPLIASAFMLGGLGFGLSAGAFVLSGIVASVFNLVKTSP